MNNDRERISAIIGSRVREYRLERKMSQENLALISGIHPNFLGKLERGERCPSIDTLYKLCCGLNITLTQLLDFDNDTGHTTDEARFRINSILEGLTDEQAVELAAIMEYIVRFKFDK